MDSLPDFRAGDRLMASHMREIVRRLDKLEGVSGSGRIQVRGGKLGSMQMAYVEGVTRSLGQANGAITARSTTTPGAGTVDLWWYNGSVLEAAGDSVAVYNVGTAISAGKYVWVEQDSFGDWYVAPLECEA